MAVMSVDCCSIPAGKTLPGILDGGLRLLSPPPALPAMANKPAAPGLVFALLSSWKVAPPARKAYPLGAMVSGLT